MNLQQWIQMQCFGWVLLWICTSTAFRPSMTSVRIKTRSFSSSRQLFPKAKATATQEMRKPRQSILQQVAGSDPNETSSCPVTRLSQRLRLWIKTVWKILMFPTVRIYTMFESKVLFEYLVVSIVLTTYPSTSFFLMDNY